MRQKKGWLGNACEYVGRNKLWTMDLSGITESEGEEMATIGVDIGTSGCKAALVAHDGRIIAQAYREYACIAVPGGGLELDTDAVMEAAMNVIRNVSAETADVSVQALSVSSIGESMAALDANGKILNRLMIYNDTRGADVEAQLSARVNHQSFFAKTGYYPSRVSSACRIMWLREHRPETYERTVCFLPVNALLLFLLGAKPHIDHTLASTTMLFDIWKKEWIPEHLAAAGIDRMLLPELVAPGSVVGRIRKDRAVALGLPENVLLVAGGHDQQCVSLGAGVIGTGDCLDGLGSVEAIGVVTDRRPDMARLARYHLSAEPHVLPDVYSVYGCAITAGTAVKWFRDCFCQDLIAATNADDEDVYERMFALLPERGNEVLWIPYFSGAGTPFNLPDARSLLIGAELRTGRGELLRALLEGVAFEMQINLECLAAAGLAPRRICTVGGLAKNARYLQMKASIIGCDVQTLAFNQAGALGAAILAECACGGYPSLREAAERMVTYGGRIVPEPAQQTAYQKKYDAYRRNHPYYGMLDLDRH